MILPPTIPTPDWNVTEEVMELLFEANSNLHQYMKNYMLVGPHAETRPDRYVRDYRTIRLNYGLRTGKAVFVLKHAKVEDLVITANDDTGEYYLLEDCKARVRSVEQLVGFSDNKLPYSICHPRIWIDDSEAVTATLSNLGWDFPLLRKYLITDPNQQMVIFG